MRPPAYLNPAVGYAMWWLTHGERGPVTGAEILDRLEARGLVSDRAEARDVLQRARMNMRAQARVANASTSLPLAAACEYRCHPDTPIAVRIRLDVRNARGQTVESRSIVYQARAGDNLGDVLREARDAFNRNFAAGTRYPGDFRYIDRDLTTADVDQVLLNYTEGSR